MRAFELLAVKPSPLILLGKWGHLRNSAQAPQHNHTDGRAVGNNSNGQHRYIGAISRGNLLSNINIQRAETEANFNAAHVLSIAWADWHWEAYPEHREIIGKVFEPEAYQRTVADLDVIHARPNGAVLIAKRHIGKLGDHPIGCVMYHEVEPGAD